MQDRTTQYAADVLAGKIIAGDLVKLACKRHLDDIEKSKAAPYKYYFDVEQAERIIEFAETLTTASLVLKLFSHFRYSFTVYLRDSRFRNI